MAARIESLVQGHQTLMVDVSHQVRTPLAALRLRLDLLSQDANDVTVAELAGAQEEIARLARLTNGLLAVARAENATAPPARVDVAAVAADRVAGLAASGRGTRCHADRDGTAAGLGRAGCRPSRADPGHLLANSLDALDTPETGGTITVTAEVAGELARVRVSDNGHGMTGQQQRAAFHRFASGTAGGTGLGLAIVNRLAVANGGAASLSDTPARGLTVTIDFPLRTSAAPAKPASPQKPVSSAAPGDLN